MSALNNSALLGASGQQGYQISRSVRLRSSASAYFSRTQATPTNNKIWTWSGWVKKGLLTSDIYLFAANNSTAPEFIKLSNSSSDAFEFAYWNGSAWAYQLRSTMVLRDPSAWYHIVVSVDTTQATASNRVRLYVNGVEVTSFSISSYPSQNTNTKINSAVAARLGSGFSSAYFDGYLTEINFIDGQALTPSSFGETNAVTGVWQPKKYAGTYGTNGFYLNFSDNSAATAATIGKDYSGNGNNWTPNNISVTAGVTYDSMLDVPTLWADGGNGRGNYATLNPLQAGNAPADGNLKATTSGTAHRNTLGTIFFPASKFYYEISVPSIQRVSAGMATPQLSLTAVAAGQAQFLGIYGDATGSTIYSGATSLFSQGAIAANDVYQFCVDPTTGNAWFGRNNTFYNSSGATTGNPAAGTNPTWSGVNLTQYAPEAGVYDAGTGANANFGQRPFAYTPPTGFKALNTLNLPEPTILKGNQYFDATTYTGQNTSLSVTNSGSMQPDFVWIKKRNGATDHNLVDSVRGTDKNLISNSAAAESTVARLTSFDSGGFTLAGAFDNTNLSGSTYVGWQWKEGATQGFDIVTYTGTGVARTVAHSLGVAPSMMIVKNRTTAVAGAWPVYHQAIGATNYLFLDLTDAQSSVATPFNDTAPTSTVFSVDGGDRVNKSGNGIVAYLFAEVAGFSKFGSYTGNGSADGPFCFTGFLPRWVMIKRTDSTGDWYIWDTARNTFNLMTQVLFADLSAAESTYAAPNPVIDVLSNGFKQRGTYPHNNASGGTYIYMAFAEHPFKNALAR